MLLRLGEELSLVPVRLWQEFLQLLGLNFDLVGHLDNTREHGLIGHPELLLPDLFVPVDSSRHHIALTGEQVLGLVVSLIRNLQHLASVP